MLNEDKIKLMTSIAMFEKREGKHIAPANRFFRSDYISGRIMRSFFVYTVCFILCALIWVLYSMERLLNVMELDEVAGAAKAGAAAEATPDSAIIAAKPTSTIFFPFMISPLSLLIRLKISPPLLNLID